MGRCKFSEYIFDTGKAWSSETYTKVTQVMAERGIPRKNYRIHAYSKNSIAILTVIFDNEQDYLTAKVGGVGI